MSSHLISYPSFTFPSPSLTLSSDDNVGLAEGGAGVDAEQQYVTHFSILFFADPTGRPTGALADGGHAVDASVPNTNNAAPHSAFDEENANDSDGEHSVQ